jgi:hypothetical protein
MAPAGSANELKALRRRHDAEHQRILDQLAEDKVEREARKRAAGSASSAPAAAASSSGAYRGLVPSGVSVCRVTGPPTVLRPASTDTRPTAAALPCPGSPPTASAGPTARLMVRTESGALRTSFSATSTLLEVRAWVDESQRVARMDEARPALVPGGGGRILVPNEQTEQIRAGRENFERQT